MSTINGRMRDGAIGEFCYKLYFLRSNAQFFTRKKITTISYVIINLYHQRGTGSRWAGFIFQGIFWPWPRLGMKFIKAKWVLVNQFYDVDLLIKFLYFLDDASKKVELTQKWSSLLEAGKNEGEIEKELGQPKLDDVTAKRAKKIIKKLNKEVEAAVSS